MLFGRLQPASTQSEMRHVKYNNLCFSLDGKEGNVLFNDALNTFYLWLYGVRHIVKDHSDGVRGNLLPQQGFFYMHHPTEKVEREV